MSLRKHSQETKNRLSALLTKPPSGDPIKDTLRLKNRLRMRRWREKNPERTRLAYKSWREKNREKIRNHSLYTKFRIRQCDWDAMYQSQEGKCGLCLVFGKTLVVDHCHTSSRVRGLLCIRCNTKLGFFEEINRDKNWKERANRWLL